MATTTEAARRILEAAKQTGEPFGSTAEDTLTDVRLYEKIYRDFLTRRGEI